MSVSWPAPPRSLWAAVLVFVCASCSSSDEHSVSTQPSSAQLAQAMTVSCEGFAAYQNNPSPPYASGVKVVHQGGLYQCLVTGWCGLSAYAPQDGWAWQHAWSHLGDCGVSDPCAGQPDGSACDDGDACTVGDACAGGACGPGATVDCGAGDECNDAPICDPASGACVSQPRPDGTVCDDGDACTDEDRCAAGNCVGTTICDPCEGAADGTPCNDGDPCTALDVCQGGTCTAGSGLGCAPGCPALNDCTGLSCGSTNFCGTLCGAACDAGCPSAGEPGCTGGNDPCAGLPAYQNGGSYSTGSEVQNDGASYRCKVGGWCGLSAYAPGTGWAWTNAWTLLGSCGGGGPCSGQPDGASCDDQNACTVADACSAGVCVGGSVVGCDDGDACTNDRCDASTGCVHTPPLSCPPTGDACTVASCNPSTGQCEVGAANEGGACDDGASCTSGDICTGGVCAGTAVVCPDTGDVCTASSCDAATGQCEVSAANEGGACDDGAACTSGDICTGGVCAGTAVVCPDTGDVCTASSCNAATGQCEVSGANEGGACDDGAACTSGDVCTGGVCAGTTLVCPDTGDVCTTASCNPATGSCEVASANEGGACDDGAGCTSGDVCTGGVCAGTAVVCPDTGDVCTTASCNPATGSCEVTATNDGASCDDGSLCTTGGACSGGQCVEEPVVCPDTGDLCTASICDPATGACAAQPANDGVACDTGQACVFSSVCNAGACEIVAATIQPVIAVVSASCGEQDGQAQVTISGGTPPYVVEWSDGGEGTERSDLGRFTELTIRDADGCSYTTTVDTGSPGDCGCTHTVNPGIAASSTNYRNLNSFVRDLLEGQRFGSRGGVNLDHGPANFGGGLTDDVTLCVLSDLEENVEITPPPGIGPGRQVRIVGRQPGWTGIPVTLRSPNTATVLRLRSPRFTFEGLYFRPADVEIFGPTVSLFQDVSHARFERVRVESQEFTATAVVNVEGGTNTPPIVGLRWLDSEIEVTDYGFRVSDADLRDFAFENNRLIGTGSRQWFGFYVTDASISGRLHGNEIDARDPIRIVAREGGLVISENDTRGAVGMSIRKLGTTGALNVRSEGNSVLADGNAYSLFARPNWSAIGVHGLTRFDSEGDSVRVVSTNDSHVVGETAGIRADLSNATVRNAQVELSTFGGISHSYFGIAIGSPPDFARVRGGTVTTSVLGRDDRPDVHGVDIAGSPQTASVDELQFTDSGSVGVALVGVRLAVSRDTGARLIGNRVEAHAVTRFVGLQHWDGDLLARDNYVLVRDLSVAEEIMGLSLIGQEDALVWHNTVRIAAPGIPGDGSGIVGMRVWHAQALDLRNNLTVIETPGLTGATLVHLSDQHALLNVGHNGWWHAGLPGLFSGAFGAISGIDTLENWALFTGASSSLIAEPIFESATSYRVLTGPTLERGVATFAVNDIEGRPRALPPDLGAYEATSQSCFDTVCDGDGCEELPSPAGTVCQSGDACALAASCDGAGQCVVEDRVSCPGAAEGCGLGDSSCDARVGGCPERSARYGAACSDADACTVGDRCGADGACEPGEARQLQCPGTPELCTTLGCHPGSGLCLATVPHREGLSCNDGQACTTGDACRAGVCEGELNTCDALATDCIAAECNPDTGACETAPANEGGGCDDGQACTTGDMCSAGSCAGEALVCPDTGDPCTAAQCNAATGSCEPVAANEGGACDDGALCTTGDVCLGGACAGIAVSCPDTGNPCTAASCNPADGQCEVAPANEGGACDDGAACTSGDVCADGVCGGATVVCPDTGDACTVAVCNPASGQCEAEPSVLCPDTGDACTVSVCNPQSGACEVEPAVVCPDTGDACTVSVCNSQSGACEVEPVVTCPDTGDPCTASVCNPQSGACEVEPANEGGACDDGAACTSEDSCVAGTCVGSPVVCPDTGNDCTFAVCEASTGACIEQETEFGTACDDGNGCTRGDLCFRGSCLGSPVRCEEPESPCEAASCDPSSGRCVVSALPTGAPCSDDAFCTSGETCDEAGRCTGGIGGLDIELNISPPSCPGSLDGVVDMRRAGDPYVTQVEWDDGSELMLREGLSEGARAVVLKSSGCSETIPVDLSPAQGCELCDFTIDPAQPSSPTNFQSLAAATSALLAGGGPASTVTYCLAPMTFDEALSVPVLPEPRIGKRVIFRNDPARAGRPLIRGLQASQIATSHVTLQGVDLALAGGDGSGYPLEVTFGSFVELVDLSVAGGVLLNTHPDSRYLVLRNSRLIGDAGLRLTGSVHHAVIDDNVIEGGVRLFDGSLTGYLRRNEIEGENAIDFSGGSWLVVEDNTLRFTSAGVRGVTETAGVEPTLQIRGNLLEWHSSGGAGAETGVGFLLAARAYLQGNVLRAAVGHAPDFFTGIAVVAGQLEASGNRFELSTGANQDATGVAAPSGSLTRFEDNEILFSDCDACRGIYFTQAGAQRRDLILNNRIELGSQGSGSVLGIGGATSVTPLIEVSDNLLRLNGDAWFATGIRLAHQNGAVFVNNVVDFDFVDTHVGSGTSHVAVDLTGAGRFEHNTVRAASASAGVIALRCQSSGMAVLNNILVASTEDAALPALALDIALPGAIGHNALWSSSELTHLRAQCGAVVTTLAAFEAQCSASGTLVALPTFDAELAVDAGPTLGAGRNYDSVLYDRRRAPHLDPPDLGAYVRGPAPCWEQVCDGDSCVLVPSAAGAACDDGNACTDQERCDGAGTCVAEPDDPCAGAILDCTAFICDPRTRACSVAPRQLGVSVGNFPGCEPVRVCTGTLRVETIDGPECLSLSPQCFEDSCSADACVVTPAPLVTECDDGDLCTSRSFCDGEGSCAIHAPVDCTPPPELGGCFVGVCDPDDGSCDFTPAGAGASCDDGDPCTENDSCDGAGGCSGAAVACEDTGDPCTAGVCNPQTGVCDPAPANDGAACDDGDLCTLADSCAGGICGGTALSCPDTGNACTAGVCDPATGECEALPANEGGVCDDGNPCTQNDSCNGAGACAGSAVACPDTGDPCTVGQCDPASGACDAVPINDGGACDDGDLCTNSDVCGGGICAGEATTCPDTGDVCTAASCNPATGACDIVPANEGGACDDGDACTLGDLCSAGACVPASTVSCPDTGNPCTASTCNPSSGACEVAALPEGQSCDDGDGCTVSDSCNLGVCEGVTFECPDTGSTCITASCESATGRCVESLLAEGTPCEDGADCTTGDACDASGHCLSGVGGPDIEVFYAHPTCEDSFDGIIDVRLVEDGPRLSVLWADGGNRSVATGLPPGAHRARVGQLNCYADVALNLSAQRDCDVCDFTVDPSRPQDATNFVSLQAAMNHAQIGVDGPRTYCLAPGFDYEGPFELGEIAGPREGRRVIFRNDPRLPGRPRVVSPDANTTRLQINASHVTVQGLELETVELRVGDIGASPSFVDLIDVVSDRDIELFLAASSRHNRVLDCVLDHASISVTGGFASVIEGNEIRESRHHGVGISMSGASAFIRNNRLLGWTPIRIATAPWVVVEHNRVEFFGEALDIHSWDAAVRRNDFVHAVPDPSGSLGGDYRVIVLRGIVQFEDNQVRTEDGVFMSNSYQAVHIVDGDAELRANRIDLHFLDESFNANGVVVGGPDRASIINNEIVLSGARNLTAIELDADSDAEERRIEGNDVDLLSSAATTMRGVVTTAVQPQLHIVANRFSFRGTADSARGLDVGLQSGVFGNNVVDIDTTSSTDVIGAMVNGGADLVAHNTLRVHNASDGVEVIGLRTMGVQRVESNVVSAAATGVADAWVLDVSGPDHVLRNQVWSTNAPSHFAALCEGNAVDLAGFESACAAGEIFIAEPQFTAIDDLSLVAGPGIDAGQPIPELPRDRRRRPRDSTPDFGAYEADAEPCWVENCDEQGCVRYPAPAGTACDDDDACTSADHCDGAGTCIGGDAVTCQDRFSLCLSDVCDPTTGECGPPEHADYAALTDSGVDPYPWCSHPSGVPAAEAGPCLEVSGGCENDLWIHHLRSCGSEPVEAGFLCTHDDLCALTATCDGAGECTPFSVRDCSSFGPECVDHACNSATGACEPTGPTEAGALCNDGDGCTEADSCDGSGQCSGEPVVCEQNDNPCNETLCHPAFGRCVTTAVEPGTPCDLPGECSHNDVCEGSVCVPGDPVVCPDSGNPCLANLCDDASGDCNLVPIAAGVACDDEDPCTSATTCDGAGSCAAGDPVVCPDTGDPCTVSVCNSAGAGCEVVAAADGVACEDGDACTQNDSCVSGVCNAGAPLSCPDTGNVCTAATCDPATGACDVGPTNEGGACDDGNPCTQGESCAAGSCGDGAAVVCADTGNPCTAAVCNPANGACEPEPTNDGGACDDGDACTQGDSCAAGACSPGAPVTCDDTGDPCTEASCNPTSGACEVGPANQGGACEDGDLCTQGDQCDQGVCSSGAPRSCAQPASHCLSAVCVPATGECEDIPDHGGESCEDGDACTLDDRCDLAGVCVPGDGVVCSDTGNPCTAGVCDPADGDCDPVPVAAGVGCDDGDACTTSTVCDGAGGCGAGEPVLCPDTGDPCTAASCNSATGACDVGPANEGGSCEDGDGCTLSDTCAAGVCEGGSPRQCADTGDVCTAAICDPATGACEVVAANEGGACDDGDACTSSETCSGGLCGDGAPALCPDTGDPCTAGVCNSQSGLCEPVPANEGGVCDDGDLCTGGDICDGAGNCASGNPVACPPSGDPCLANLCDPASGECVATPVTAGTACEDGDTCTTGDQCDGAGTCLSGAGTSCDDGNPCTDDACDPAGGCSYRSNADSCEDGDACTTGDRCEAGICVSGPPSSCAPGCPAIDDCTGVSCGGINSCGTACGEVCDAGCASAAAGPCGGGCGGLPQYANGGSYSTGDHVQNDGSEYRCKVGGWCGISAYAPGTGWAWTHAWTLIGPCGSGNPCAGQPDGTACDDGNACTSGDACAGELCVGSAQACDDGNPCTDDRCDSSTGCQYVPNAAPCDDGDDCTIHDYCAGGSCGAGAFLDCDDTEACTDDLCHPGGYCLHPFNFDPCEDGDLCTTDDRCDGAGHCDAGPALVCENPGHGCSLDVCDPQSGLCEPQPRNVGQPCDDLDLCTSGETCNADGVCVPGSAVECPETPDVCTTGACDPTTGGCIVVPANEGQLCDDGDPGTSGERCDAGVCHVVSLCQPGACDDGDPCTIDFCDPAVGCQVGPADLCAPGCPAVTDCSIVDCGGTNACGTACGELCGAGCPEAGGPSCVAGGCEGVPHYASGQSYSAGARVQNDGVEYQCTVAGWCGLSAYAPGTGWAWRHAWVEIGPCGAADPCEGLPDGSACDDGNACTDGDACAGGVCAPGAPRQCDDQDACTEDYCDSSLGCQSNPRPPNYPCE